MMAHLPAWWADDWDARNIAAVATVARTVRASDSANAAAAGVALPPGALFVSAFSLARNEFVAYLLREQRYEFTAAEARLLDAGALRRAGEGLPLDAPVDAGTGAAAGIAAVATSTECERTAARARAAGAACLAVSPHDAVAALSLPAALPLGQAVRGVVCVGSTELRYRTEKSCSALHHFDAVARSFAAPLWMWGRPPQPQQQQQGQHEQQQEKQQSMLELRPGKRYLQFCLRASYELGGRWGYANFLHTSALADGTVVAAAETGTVGTGAAAGVTSEQAASPGEPSETQAEPTEAVAPAEGGYVGATSLAHYVAEREDVYGLQAVRDVQFRFI
jgi:hypothetical protein